MPLPSSPFLCSDWPELCQRGELSSADDGHGWEELVTWGLQEEETGLGKGSKSKEEENAHTNTHKIRTRFCLAHVKVFCPSDTLEALYMPNVTIILSKTAY